MGGKVLPLPSDKLRKEREMGHLQTLVENIEILMRMQNWTLQQACEALGSTEEIYYMAKEKLK